MSLAVDKLLPTRWDVQALMLIRRAGRVHRDICGNGFLPDGSEIGKKELDRLIIMGLVEPVGDALFGVPSQTYIPKKENQCSENK